MTDRPDPPEHDPFGSNPFDPMVSGDAQNEPTSTHRSTAAGHEPDFDPELTAPVSSSSTGQQHVPAQQPPAPDEEPFDPERTTVVTSTPPLRTPPPVISSGHTPHGGPTPPSARQPSAPPSPPPSYAPPPVFTAQHAPLPPPKNRRPFYIAIIAACVVAAVVLVAVIASVSGGDTGSNSSEAATPADAARGYLEALARGDANAALAFGLSEPGSRELLTDDILEQQISRAPITDINILDDGSPVGAYARIHVSAKFGAQISDTQLSMRKTDDGWKLNNAAVKLDLSSLQGANKALQYLTVFDRPTTSPVYVFPGWVDYGSSNPNLAFEVGESLLNQLEMFTLFSSVQAQLSPDAQTTINSTLSDDLAKCTSSSRLAPPGCPLRLNQPNLVDGTLQWEPFRDLGQIHQTFNQYQMTVAIDGTVKTLITAQTRTGGPLSGNVTGFISATANVSVSPPTITYR